MSSPIVNIKYKYFPYIIHLMTIHSWFHEYINRGEKWEEFFENIEKVITKKNVFILLLDVDKLSFYAH